MGIWNRIKNWFRKITTGETKVKEVTMDYPARTEAHELIEEYAVLNTEREQIRLQLGKIDDQFNMGEIEAAEHDRQYRQYLARAGQIRLRQMAIRSRLAELGQPLPEPTMG